MSDSKYDKALEAIKDLFGDVSRTQEETAESLRTLIFEIEMMLDTLGG